MSDFKLLTFMDKLFDFCYQNRVSDLHFEPFEQGLKLRYRHIGLLIDWTNVTPALLLAAYQRFKALGHLDITPRRTPQDGHMIWKSSECQDEIPCRLSTCPTPYGEKLVIRLMTHELGQLSFDKIGLSDNQSALIQSICDEQQGLILVTGPTGSGKTTTLYTIIQYLQNFNLNIVSIEDPIEIPWKNITQIELLPTQGFGMQDCLRTVLRQDPDIIMIGEIRDSLGANLAIQAAQTGHLVLSSLHTPHGLGAFQRLMHLGISTHDVKHELRLIISQSLRRFSNTERIASFELIRDFSC